MGVTSEFSKALHVDKVLQKRMEVRKLCLAFGLVLAFVYLPKAEALSCYKNTEEGMVAEDCGAQTGSIKKFYQKTKSGGTRMFSDSQRRQMFHRRRHRLGCLLLYNRSLQFYSTKQAIISGLINPSFHLLSPQIISEK